MVDLIELGDLVIQVSRKNIKNVHLSVHPPHGKVTLAAPIGTRLEVARAYAISKLGWIRLQQQKLAEQAREAPRQFITRETHWLWGRRHLLSKSGTIELLLTKAVSDWQVVFGKFLACLVLILIALGLTIPSYLTVWNLGPVDHGSVISGYLGLILMSATYISIGIYTSSITNNQIVAFLLAILIGIFFHIIFDVLAGSLQGISEAFSVT